MATIYCALWVVSGSPREVDKEISTPLETGSPLQQTPTEEPALSCKGQTRPDQTTQWRNQTRLKKLPLLSVDYTNTNIQDGDKQWMVFHNPSLFPSTLSRRETPTECIILPFFSEARNPTWPRPDPTCAPARSHHPSLPPQALSAVANQMRSWKQTQATGTLTNHEYWNRREPSLTRGQCCKTQDLQLLSSIDALRGH